MNIKGLTYIPKPLEGIDSRTVPRSHGQVLSELASLYRQEVRLEEKLVVSCDNHMQTRRELRQVQQRRTVLERILDQAADEGRSPSAERKSGDGGGREAAIWREIPLEAA